MGRWSGVWVGVAVCLTGCQGHRAQLVLSAPSTAFRAQAQTPTASPALPASGRIARVSYLGRPVAEGRGTLWDARRWIVLPGSPRTNAAGELSLAASGPDLWLVAVTHGEAELYAFTADGPEAVAIDLATTLAGKLVGAKLAEVAFTQPAAAGLDGPLGRLRALETALREALAQPALAEAVAESPVTIAGLERLATRVLDDPGVRALVLAEVRALNAEAAAQIAAGGTAIAPARWTRGAYAVEPSAGGPLEGPYPAACRALHNEPTAFSGRSGGSSEGGGGEELLIEGRVR